MEGEWGRIFTFAAGAGSSFLIWKTWLVEGVCEGKMRGGVVSSGGLWVCRDDARFGWVQLPRQFGRGCHSPLVRVEACVTINVDSGYLASYSASEIT